MKGFLIYLVFMTALVVMVITVRRRVAVSEPYPRPQPIQLFAVLFALTPLAAFWLAPSISPWQPLETALRVMAGAWTLLGLIPAAIAAARGRLAFEAFKSSIARGSGMSFRSIVLLWAAAIVLVVAWSFLHRRG